MLIEQEDGALEIDQVAKLVRLVSGASIDVEGHLAHFDAGDVLDEGGVGDAEDKAAEDPPASLEFDVLDLAVGDGDGLHLPLAAGEDAALEAPVDIEAFGKKAELAQHFLAAERIVRRNRELDVDRIDAEHAGVWIPARPEGRADSRDAPPLS